MNETKYIATDDREIERADGLCNHRRCPPGECCAYTPATLRITPADEELARQLVAEGWWSTSRKSRSIARWKEPIPPIEQMFRPEFLATFHGERLAELVRDHVKWNYGVSSPKNAARIEHATLSPSLFDAFKKAGGDCGR